jgi:hypothetical protein
VAQDEAQSPDCTSHNSKRSRNTEAASSNPTQEIHFQLAEKAAATASLRFRGGWFGVVWGDGVAQPRRALSSFRENNVKELSKKHTNMRSPDAVAAIHTLA